MIAFLLAQTIAITGGTVYPVAGPKLAKATVLIRDGRIAAVGTDVSVPSDATRIDAAGKWVTPGLIDGAGQLGLVEISAVPGTREGSIQGDTIAAAFSVAEGINPASTLIPVTRIEGITTALAVPAGNLVSGQAVLIDLDSFSIGPREWDLIQTALFADRLGWHTAEEYRSFVEVYGYDIMKWDGYETLADMREVAMTAWLAKKAATDEKAAAEVHKRITAMRTGGSRRDWGAY